MMLLATARQSPAAWAVEAAGYSHAPWHTFPRVLCAGSSTPAALRTWSSQASCADRDLPANHLERSQLEWQRAPPNWLGPLTMPRYCETSTREAPAWHPHPATPGGARCNFGRPCSAQTADPRTGGSASLRTESRPWRRPALLVVPPPDVASCTACTQRSCQRQCRHNSDTSNRPSSLHGLPRIAVCHTCCKRASNQTPTRHSWGNSNRRAVRGGSCCICDKQSGCRRPGPRTSGKSSRWWSAQRPQSEQQQSGHPVAARRSRPLLASAFRSGTRSWMQRPVRCSQDKSSLQHGLPSPSLLERFVAVVQSKSGFTPA